MEAPVDKEAGGNMNRLAKSKQSYGLLAWQTTGFAKEQNGFLLKASQIHPSWRTSLLKGEDQGEGWIHYISPQGI